MSASVGPAAVNLGGEFTWLAVFSVVAVVGAELFWFRTGLFGKLQFWIAYAVIVFFECLVDGWLTKLSAPIVIYDPDQYLGWRFPFDIPVEDFLFGFSLIVLVFLCWERAGVSAQSPPQRGNGAV